MEMDHVCFKHRINLLEKMIENEAVVQWINLPDNARVCMAISNGRWSDIIMGIECEGIINMTCNVEINSWLDKDRVVWRSNTSGKFSHRTANQAIRKKKPTVNWHRLVWDKWIVLKHQFFAWQVCSNILQTQDKLAKKRILQQSGCCICDQGRENSKHSFF